jgi:hypothetical protein
MDWISDFSELNLGEKRLNRRFNETLKLFFIRPGDTIAGACGNWAKSKGAYRLLGHRRFKRETILELHQTKTIERIKDHPVVLLIQDTTTLNYQAHLNTEGLGPVGSSKKAQGFLMHTLLAVTPELNPLGILDCQTWVRPLQKSKVRGEGKESLKWLKGLESGSFKAEQKISSKSTKLITISDRESDINDYLGLAFDNGSDVIVRAMSRRLDFIEGLPLRESLLKGSEVLGSFSIEVERKYVSRSASYDRKNSRLKTAIKRTASVEVRAQSVMIKVRGSSGDLSEVPYTCVYVREQNPPSDEESVEWLLLTSLGVTNFKEARAVISYYEARWFIEVFHRTLKSGCGVEKSRVSNVNRLQNYLLMMSLSALSICQLTYGQRNTPEETCEIILSPTQWQALYLYFNQNQKFPEKPPNLQEATMWVAKLGGFLARKSDGYPGTLTLWKGWLRLNDIHESYLRFCGKNCG